MGRLHVEAVTWNEVLQVPKVNDESLTNMVANKKLATLHNEQRSKCQLTPTHFMSSQTYEKITTTRSPVEYCTMGNFNALTCQSIKVDLIPEGICVVGLVHYAAFYIYQQGSHNYPTAFKFESAQDTATWIDYYA
jgi:hypothetical protein